MLLGEIGGRRRRFEGYRCLPYCWLAMHPKDDSFPPVGPFYLLLYQRGFQAAPPSLHQPQCHRQHLIYHWPYYCPYCSLRNSVECESSFCRLGLVGVMSSDGAGPGNEILVMLARILRPLLRWALHAPRVLSSGLLSGVRYPDLEVSAR